MSDYLAELNASIRDHIDPEVWAAFWHSDPSDSAETVVGEGE